VSSSVIDMKIVRKACVMAFPSVLLIRAGQNTPFLWLLQAIFRTACASWRTKTVSVAVQYAA
jgi:hypothetical protein